MTEQIQIDELHQLLTKKEALHRDLVPFLSSYKGISCLRSPLLYSVPYSPNLNAMLNSQYVKKKEYVRNLFERGKYESYIYVHEKPYQLNAFLECESFLNDNARYWEILRFIWTQSENTWQNKQIWKLMFKSRWDSRQLFMTDSDKNTFEKLPDELKVYRGYVPKRNKNGISHTLDKEKAEWFAKRFNANGEILERTVLKSKVLYTNQRNEQEIIIL